MAIAQPRPTEMNALSTKVFDVLEESVVSPWQMLKVECGWRGFGPLQLDAHVLAFLVPKLRFYVTRISDDDNGAACGGLAGIARNQQPTPKACGLIPRLVDRCG